MNYYEILRVYPGASNKIIKDAYRALVKKYHPDLFDSEGQKQWAEEKMKGINEAYEVLMDDNKRNLYDKDQGFTNEVIPTTLNIDKERLISFSIALVYIVFTLIFGGIYVIATIIYLIFPMAAIWFSDELGDYTGSIGRNYIDTKSPGCIVKVIGWVMLMLPLLLLLSEGINVPL